jgi:hypothetical protein
MILNGFRCDSCNKEHLLDPDVTIQMYLPVLPVTWFMVSQPPANERNLPKPLVFCSPQCVIVHMNKLV